ncbi:MULTISPECIES: NAD-binding protein [Mycobacterium]|uniref:Potassium transporter TrkA n=1 Tax=Mycobacterium gordonae TaxID=1778 RepID=A0A1A6BD82_MYCGO|nr:MULTISPECIES: NAD-binding protein [Mycobacterium]MCQ4364153.1 NAD-binding protein [Mycobacterium gordonae]MCV7009775.1 NAD-binding protein [Mycobacterium gordonae]OBS00246.1 potassium transporter TrkA [Mycobacterium gordonae]ODR19126.1 potassium transporter TrkA [Mycobacterium gordonae]PJE09387.1 MAG: potassium transporter TrkA [Mycobacterium sp.]
MGEVFQFHREIIVSGDDPLSKTIAEELRGAGARIIKINTAADLRAAGVHRARAVVCAGPNDAVNLEIALLAREFSPNVRVVARLANEVLRRGVAGVNGPGAILDLADLATPSIVEAVLSRNAHQFEAAGIEFVVWGSEASHDATLRELYADLAPVAVVHGRNSPVPGEVVPCPGRDQQVYAGDWTSMIGVKDELEARGITVPPPSATRSRHSRTRRAIDALRAMRDDLNPLVYPSLLFTLLLTLGSTVVVRLGHHNPELSWLDALYFASETITTVGYGDFSFAYQSPFLRLFAVGLMFGGVIITAVLTAFLADLLLSRRFVNTTGRLRARHMRGHVVVVGLGSIGVRVVTDLTAAGYDVLVVEQNENNPFLQTVAELDVPVIFGDSTMRQTLESARVDHARGVAVVTRDDMENIETGIVLLEILGSDTKVPIVMRVQGRALGTAINRRFGFENVRSIVDLAAPWFIGAAMGLQVLGTFWVGQRSFMVGAMLVAAGSELDGLLMLELSTQTRVIAIIRPEGPIRLRPRRDARLKAGDTVYLIGPYRELIATLRKGQPPPLTAVNGERTTTLAAARRPDVRPPRWAHDVEV